MRSRMLQPTAGWRKCAATGNIKLQLCVQLTLPTCPELSGGREVVLHVVHMRSSDVHLKLWTAIAGVEIDVQS